MSPLEPLFCPCCSATIAYALSQYGSQVLSQSCFLLGSGSLSTAIGLAKKPQAEVINSTSCSSYPHQNSPTP